jgi:membrane fusion protein
MTMHAVPKLHEVHDEEPLPAVKTNLFRSEVMAEQQTQWLGTVLLAPRLSHTLFTVFAGLVIASLLALVFLGDYTRKARINGWLVPETGLVRIFAPTSGRIVQLLAQEGAEVRKGEPLALISTEVESGSLGATRKQIVQQLASRRESMRLENERQEQLFRTKAEELTTRMGTILAEQEHLEREVALQRDRVVLAESGVRRIQELRQRGLATEQKLQEADSDRLDQALRLQALERTSVGAERERLRLLAEIEVLPLNQATKLAEIERSIAELDQQIAEAEAQREVLITAPQDGIVTRLQNGIGSSVDANSPLLSIVPADSHLVAELFSPSRAIGFVEAGHPVLLRYQAFPYQKFGTYEGTVVSISQTAVSPSEFLPNLSELAVTPGGTPEPVYRIRVALAQQSATAYGEQVMLQPGMQLDADIVIERRRLIEWILDPVFTLTGRWGQ